MVTEMEHKKSRRMAALAVGFVVVFASCFVGLVSFLDSVENSRIPAEEGAPPVAEDALTTEPFYVLLIGSDTRKGTVMYTGDSSEHAQVDQHADVVTLVRVDPVTFTLTLVTIPSDTVLSSSGLAIGDSLLYSNPETVVSAVETLTGVEVTYYLMTTFLEFENLVDEVGGVLVEVPTTVTFNDPATAQDVTVESGLYQYLHGSESLVFARAIEEYSSDQDAWRQSNVRQLEEALLDKVISLDEEDVRDLVVAALTGNVDTDLEVAQIVQLAELFSQNSSELTIYSCTGPYALSETHDGRWVVLEDWETWSELMEAVDSGLDPSGIVELPSDSEGEVLEP